MTDWAVKNGPLHGVAAIFTPRIAPLKPKPKPSAYRRLIVGLSAGKRNAAGPRLSQTVRAILPA